MKDSHLKDIGSYTGEASEPIELFSGTKLRFWWESYRGLNKVLESGRVYNRTGLSGFSPARVFLNVPTPFLYVPKNAVAMATGEEVFLDNFIVFSVIGDDATVAPRQVFHAKKAGVQRSHPVPRPVLTIKTKAEGYIARRIQIGE